MRDPVETFGKVKTDPEHRVACKKRALNFQCQCPKYIRRGVPWPEAMLAFVRPLFLPMLDVLQAVKRS